MFNLLEERAKEIKWRHFTEEALKLFDALVSDRCKTCPEFCEAELGDPVPYGSRLQLRPGRGRARQLVVELKGFVLLSLTYVLSIFC